MSSYNSDNLSSYNSDNLTMALMALTLILIAVVVCNGCYNYSQLYKKAYRHKLCKCKKYKKYKKEPFNSPLNSFALEQKNLKPKNLNQFPRKHHLYSTSDIDPEIMGELYNRAKNIQEFVDDSTVSSVESLEDGDLKYLGLNECSTQVNSTKYDNAGIPKNWAIPSNPVKWYKSDKEDYYGPQGVTVYDKGLYNPSVPDHDILLP